MSDESGITRVFGKYLDLDKLVSVSDAEFVDEMGSGGFWVEFTVEAQLLQEPMHFREQVRYPEYDFSGVAGRSRVLTVSGEMVDLGELAREGRTAEVAAVARAQERVDALVAEWRARKARELTRGESAALEALEPFASVAAEISPKLSDASCWCGQNGAVIRHGDLRRAKTVYDSRSISVKLD